MTEPAPYDDSAPPPQPVNTGRGCLGACLILPLVVLGIGYGVSRGLQAMWQAEADGVLAKLRTEGLGIDSSSLHSRPPTPNGADLLAPALESMLVLNSRPESLSLSVKGLANALLEPNSLEAQVFQPEETLDGPQDVVEAIALIVARVDALDESVDAALAAPGVVFDVDWSDGYMALLPHLLPLKQLVIAYAVRAVRRQLDGDPRAWADAIQAAKLTALHDEPILISRLVRMACVGVTVTVVGELLAHGPPPDAQTQVALDEALEGLEGGSGLTRAMRGELAMCMTTFDEHSGALAKELLDVELPFMAGPFYAYWRADYAETMAKMIRATTLRPDRALAEASGLSQEAARGSTIVQLLTPALAQAFRQELAARARLRMARLALQLARGGDLPATLPEPVLADPLDPALGPLGWQRAGRRRGTLSSVGSPDRGPVTFEVSLPD